MYQVKQSQIASALLLILLLMAVALLGQIWQNRSTLGGSPGGTQNPNRSPASDVLEEAMVELPPTAWSVFAKKEKDSSRDAAPDDNRFRYVGWFFMLNSPDVQAQDVNRSGILEDVEKNRQYFIREGDLLDERYEVLRILQDRTILRLDGEEIEVWLNMKGGLTTKSGETTHVASLDGSEPGETVLETNRFGKRVGENRWLISKQTLIDYYNELIEDPERIAAIYATHKPEYNDEREITGYRIEMEGEKDFFEAIGIREGDRIRKVNSMNMTSQSRAEYFIAEFMRDRLGAVVMDVERDGETKKLIYLLEE